MDSPSRKGAREPVVQRVAGVKRPASALLPPFEPLSSSPALPRLVKKARGNSSGITAQNAYTKYPTPVPTSSTGIMSSSPPPRAGTRPQLQRTLSSASERAPLCAVPSVELKENGEPLMMGRSSNASQYQLSANRLISRVHVKARYVPAMEPLQPNRVEIVCCGWNGMKLHCQGRTWDLSKGDTFTSETENTEIMIDVQDARVRIQWPKRDRSDLLSALSDSSWDDSPRSAKDVGKLGLGGLAPAASLGAPGASVLQMSPLHRITRIASPESPTPAGVPASATSLQALLSQHVGSEDEEDDDGGAPIKIYEDGSADELDLPLPHQSSNGADASFATDVMGDSFSSELSELQSENGDGDSDDGDDGDDKSSQNGDSDDGDHDPDEENDPIIHSFGPFGANLSNRLASFCTSSPKVDRPPLSRIPSADGSLTSMGSAEATEQVAVEPVARPAHKPRPETLSQQRAASGSPQLTPTDGVGLGITVGLQAAGTSGDESNGHGLSGAVDEAASSSPPPALISINVDVDTVRNHLINQLAFSRLSSSPLSTIMNNLPAEERRDLTRDALRAIIEGTACVGVIPRQGKDAAGQPLESEYYYISDMDADHSRRAAVDGLRKPSLRNCRKQHKQYYWKKPRTP